MFIGEFYYDIPTVLPSLSLTSFYYIAFVFILFCLYRLCVHLRPLLLLAGSLFFLYSFSVKALIAVLVEAVFSYFFCLILSQKQKKIILILSLLPVIGTLIYFKYAGFFLDISPAMPLGLSFYSFKIMAVLFDSYRGKVKIDKNPLYYLNYVLFFPCITAGPIHDYSSFLKDAKERKEFRYEDFKEGFVLLLLGIFEKVVFCDFIASIVSLGIDNVEVKGIRLLICVILYSFQIYLDFDSCSNIAIGTAGALGFSIKRNFHSPYLAKNLNEFWQRWHISLSSWLRDYVYIPLGGNRKGKYRRYFNLLIVFLISGMWHGSTLNFILWGLLHALIQILELLIADCSDKKKQNRFISFVASLIGMGINFVIVTFLWLIFKCEDLGEVQNILFRITEGGSSALGITVNEEYWLAFILVTVIVLDIFRNYFDMTHFLCKQFFLIRWLVYGLLIVVFLIFGVYGGSHVASDFIYQFF